MKINILKKKPAKTKETAKTSKNTETQNPGYAIQTGAFQNQNNALRMKKKLINMGFDSRILTLKDSKDKTWYLVRSGNYSDKNNSQKDFSLQKSKRKADRVLFSKSSPLQRGGIEDDGVFFIVSFIN